MEIPKRVDIPVEMSTSFDVAGLEDAPSLHVSVSRTEPRRADEDDTYEELKLFAHAQEGPQTLSNELYEILQQQGGQQLLSLKDVVDRTVSNEEYRRALACEPDVAENLILVLKQSLVLIEPIYDQLSMNVDALRMDTGSVDEDHQKRLYLTKFALVLRILNILKNLLVANPKIQEDLYKHKVVLQIVKLIPKAMVAREISIRQGQHLLTDTSTVNSHHIPREFLRTAIPICAKSDHTLVTFFLNSIAGDKKMQDFIRPQLWSGPMAILAMTVCCSTGLRSNVNPDRYAKDVFHFITLFNTLFVNVTETELADWWELEETPLWEPKGELGHGRADAEQRAAINNSLQRTATNLSMQLSVPGWNAGNALSGESAQQAVYRPGTVVGALMEPQTSSVSGKGVHMDRMKSFRVIADKSGGTGSLGLNGREALLIILTCLIAAIRFIENSDTQATDAHASFHSMLLHLSNGKLDFWHAFLKTFKKCRAINRLLKAIAINKSGPGNPIELGVDEHQNESIYYLMSGGVVRQLVSLFEGLQLSYPRDLSLEKLDDALRYQGEEMNQVLIRSCVSEVLFKEVLLRAIDAPNEPYSAKLPAVIDFLAEKTSTEAGLDLNTVAQLLKDTESHDNMKLYATMMDLLSRPYEGDVDFRALLEHVATIAEDCDHHDPMSQVSAGMAMRLANETLPRMPPSELTDNLIVIAMGVASRWLKTMKFIIGFEFSSVEAVKQEKQNANEMRAGASSTRRYLRQTCGMSGTLCLELLVTVCTEAQKDSANKAEVIQLIKENRVAELILFCASVLSEDEPTIRERATLAIAAVTSITEGEA